MARSSGSTRRASRKRSASGSRESGGRRQAGGRATSGAKSRSSTSGSRSRHVTKVTTDHEVIRRWAEERGAQPARVQGTGGNEDVGIIRLEFPDAPGARDEKLEQISWDDWFREFDARGLAFVYEETTASGKKSNFNKLVKRETVKAKAARA